MHFLTSRTYRYAELLMLTLGIPLLILSLHQQRLMLPILWLAALYCILVRRWTDGTRPQADWRSAAVTWAVVRPLLLCFVPCALLLALGTAQFAPESLFNFLRSAPGLWALVMVLYPLLSVLPQEIIYRWFFFARYADFFPARLAMIASSAVAFACGHLIFGNWVSPLLSLVGGALFAATYQRYRSLALVSLEHALYGDFVFTIGLGWYFYHGAQ